MSSTTTNMLGGAQNRETGRTGEIDPLSADRFAEILEGTKNIVEACLNAHGIYDESAPQGSPAAPKVPLTKDMVDLAA